MAATNESRSHPRPPIGHEVPLNTYLCLPPALGSDSPSAPPSAPAHPRLGLVLAAPGLTNSKAQTSPGATVETLRCASRQSHTSLRNTPNTVGHLHGGFLLCHLFLSTLKPPTTCTLPDRFNLLENTTFASIFRPDTSRHIPLRERRYRQTTPLILPHQHHLARHEEVRLWKEGG
jgi:hypothetical protein